MGGLRRLVRASENDTLEERTLETKERVQEPNRRSPIRDDNPLPKSGNRKKHPSRTIPTQGRLIQSSCKNLETPEQR